MHGQQQPQPGRVCMLIASSNAQPPYGLPGTGLPTTTHSGYEGPWGSCTDLARERVEDANTVVAASTAADQSCVHADGLQQRTNLQCLSAAAPPTASLSWVGGYRGPWRSCADANSTTARHAGEYRGSLE